MENVIDTNSIYYVHLAEDTNAIPVSLFSKA